jgi:hypothetical protein
MTKFPILSATISIKTSLSDAVDLGGGGLVGLIFPTLMVGQGVTLKGSYDGGSNFIDIADETGALIYIPFTSLACVTVIHSDAISPVVKLQSVKAQGKVYTPVIETATIKIYLAIKGT